MRKERKLNFKKHIGIIALLAFIVMAFTSCAVGFLGIGDTASWKEEVLLHDGSKIIVERSQSRGGTHEIGQTPPVKEHSIKFTLPGTNKVIKWQDEFSHEIGRSNFTLLALHILNVTPYIITTPRLCLSYNKWGRPNPPYVIFKHENNEWKRIAIAELPAEFKNINLVINSESHEEKHVSQGLASAELVKELNSSLTQVEFKNILRTPIKIGCDELVYDGKYWRGIGWYKDQPSYEACLKVCNQGGISAEYCPCKKLFNIDSKGEK